MSSSQTTVDFILEQVADAGAVTAKKMFGEYGIFLDGKMAAIVADDLLLVKPTAEGRSFVGECEERAPYPGAKPYLFIAGDQWDDREWMSRLIRITADALPVPKKKTPRGSR